MEDSIPTSFVTREQIGEGIPIWKLLVITGMCKSGNEAKRLIQQGGLYICTRSREV